MTFFGLAAVMWNHIPAMQGRMDALGIERPHLSADEMADLVLFLFTVHYSEASGDTEAGRDLFVERRCIMCHQVGGVGGVAGPDLDRGVEFDSPSQVAAAMWNHGPAMAESMRSRGIERGTFTGAELVDLLAYINSAGDASREISLLPLPGSTSRGGELYRTKRCDACHGVQGSGGRGPNLAQRGRDWGMADFAAAMWNKAPAMLAQMQVAGLRAPELTAPQMADIVAYLHSLRYFETSGDPGLGRRQVRDRGCLECHSLDGRGGGSASELAMSQRWDSPAAVLAALWNHTLVTETVTEGEDRGWPTFEEKEMAHLIAFLQAQ
jgi:mono/diheme cytochrome c family protein